MNRKSGGCFFLFNRFFQSILTVKADQIYSCFHKLFKLSQNFLITLYIYPVIAVNNLKEYTCCIGKTCIYCLTVAAIFLMYSLYYVWILFFILSGYF